MRDIRIELIIVAAVFLVALVAALTLAQSIVAFEFALTWTIRVIGGLIAAYAAYTLIRRGLAGESLDRQLLLVVPLLAALLLFSAHWAIGLSLGAVAVALIVRQMLGRATGVSSASPADAPVPPSESGTTSPPFPEADWNQERKPS